MLAIIATWVIVAFVVIGLTAALVGLLVAIGTRD
jgi:hypothetical protein